MTIKRFDVLGLGNAMIDVFVEGDDTLLQKFHLDKKTMTLINETKAEQMYKTLSISKEMSGGGEANVVAAVTSLGGTGAFIGKVKNDMLGQRFIEKLHGRGIEFHTPPNEGGIGTGRSFIIVTPDGLRSMSTYLGASTSLCAGDVDEKLIHASRVLYLTGYLWDNPSTKEAAERAIEFAQAHDTRIALSLADPLCAERHRDIFLTLIEDTVDILFANQKEVSALFNTDDFQHSVHEISKLCANGKIAALTCGKDGVIIINDDSIMPIAGETVEHIIDTTGAGASFAAGFIYGYAHNYTLEAAAKLGNVAAAAAIQSFGARPEAPLSDLL